MSTRKYLRGMARATMVKNGVEKPNKHLASYWRRIMHAHPEFHGKKKQHRGSKQPVIIYRFSNEE